MRNPLAGRMFRVATPGFFLAQAIIFALMAGTFVMMSVANGSILPRILALIFQIISLAYVALWHRARRVSR